MECILYFLKKLMAKDATLPLSYAHFTSNAAEITVISNAAKADTA